MKLTIKFVPILVLLLLASPLILLKGCGKALNGGPSGACPDSVAPSGSTITKPADLDAPVVGSATCYSGLPFTVIDSESKEMNGICVEITTNAFIALHTVSDSECTNVVLGAKTTIVTRTDDYGNVSVDLVTLPTTTGEKFFVEVASGAASAVVRTAPAVAP